jgi:cytoskeletal protein CcmA (bactofilin family)
MPEVRIKEIDEHEIDTILAEDIDFEGHLTFKKPLMVKGKFKGEIKSTSSFYVGEKAYVEAKVESNVVSSKGRISGDIIGHSRVELFSTARVDGDITTPDFVVESGCKLNGYCNMGGVPARREAAPAQPAVPQHPEQQPGASQAIRPVAGNQPQSSPQPSAPQPFPPRPLNANPPQGGQKR